MGLSAFKHIQSRKYSAIFTFTSRELAGIQVDIKQSGSFHPVTESLGDQYDPTVKLKPRRRLICSCCRTSGSIADGPARGIWSYRRSTAEGKRSFIPIYLIEKILSWSTSFSFLWITEIFSQFMLFETMPFCQNISQMSLDYINTSGVHNCTCKHAYIHMFEITGWYFNFFNSYTA